MALSSGGSSGSSSLLSNSGFSEDLLAVMDQKKRKRMLSNRESAKRSRMRKHKHLNDLMAEISQLKEKNSQIRTSLNLYTQNNLVLETQNSVLRTQVVELTSWLSSLNGILQCMNLNCSSVNPQMMASELLLINPWSPFLMNQPTMASPDMLNSVLQDDFFSFSNEGI
ncbi:bZIP transcription factor 11-like [Dendrobium catenatum]|uniref:Ocs element-binding factor 1 n=1 Tax=Dendrobium catenatum TaxID=906689 RepID=A0A2I0VP52_9ASPA|nr:bZIP transcription factor 11-like [Dendrobium catenatum]PKU65180.1 Ocs element-binding factor 1 [Dendrobium catenatum]